MSGLRLRRPSPFKARLKERQRQRIEQLRSQSAEKQNNNNNIIRRPASIPRLPAGIGANRAPIFVSTRTENIQRKPKGDSPPAASANNNDEAESSSPSDSSAEGGNSIRLPPGVAAQRERARQRINALFRRRRPNFLRPRPAGAEDPLEVQESRARARRKRQVSSYGGYGSRTRARQSYIRTLRSSSSQYDQHQPQYFDSLDNKPFTAFRSNAAYSPDAYTSYEYQSPTTSTSYDTGNNGHYYDSDSNLYSSSSSSGSTTSSSSSKPRSSSSSKKSGSSTSSKRRLVRQQSSEDSRSRSRFNPALARNRLRTRTRGSSSAASTTTTTQRPSFSRFRPRTISSSSNRNRFTSNRGRPQTSLFDYDYDYDYDYDIDLQSSQNSVPDAITVTHTVPIRTVIPIVENGRNTFRDILTTSPSLEVIAVTSLKSTNIDGSPVIFANAQTGAGGGLGTKVITFEALRATETTTIEFTPTRIRGLRTSFSHAVPSTIYNIRPVTTSVVEDVDQSQVLTSLLLQLLGGQAPGGKKAPIATAPLPQGNPLLGNIRPAAPQAPATQFITHTNTYVTTLTNVESTVLPITLRGREIKTTLVESKTEVVTATEFSTETKINPTAAVLGGLGGPFGLPTAAAQPQANVGLPADLQQQLLLAQLQQQLAAQNSFQQQQQNLQQQQLLNQQILSQVNLDPEGAINFEQTQAPDPVVPEGPKTSVVTVFVSGSKPGDFTKITSTVILEEEGDEKIRKRREALSIISPAKVEPVAFTAPPVILSSDGEDAAYMPFYRIPVESDLDSSLSQPPPGGSAAHEATASLPFATVL